ncbi:MAG: hypothetical protein J1F23_02440 [Oscillospiraceae bacterium]|nr:hypothetical protein [Oscillospiraceae bacterium]
MKKCPQCYSVFGDTMENCPDCGCKLEYTAESNAPAPGAPIQNNGYAYNPYAAPQFKYCQRCGNKCDPMAVVCVKCGSPFQSVNMNTVPAQDDVPSTWLKVACFLVPILGLILYLIDRDKRPISAKAYGKMALIGLIVSIVLSILISIASSIFSIFIMRSALDNYGGWEDEWYAGDYYYSYSCTKTVLSNIWTMFR